MLKPMACQFGLLRGAIYDFEVEGDKLPMHNHSESDVHITMVTKGSFLVRGPDRQQKIEKGNFIDWQPNEPHEFEALEPDSRIINLIKGA